MNVSWKSLFYIDVVYMHYIHQTFVLCYYKTLKMSCIFFLALHKWPD